MKKIWVLVILIGICVGLIPTSLKGQTAPVTQSPVFSSGAEALPTSQIIIKFTDNTLAAARLADSQDNLLSQLSQAAGVDVAYGRPMSGDAHVLILPQAYPAKEVAVMAAEMEKVAGVEYAEPDLIKTIDGRADKPLFIPNLTPNDTRFGEQWHYGYTPNTAEGLNLLNAWEISTGSASTNVAVIDTGILAHTDLAGKTVPGYDFIDDVAVANDGNGRDSNPADPGDWIVANECGYPHGSSGSSWHGTHVAGTIGAATNNNLGVAGVNWHAKILPVRVLGKCGGYTSDIVDGMRWAAGLSVTGVPANANPAKVLNLSLGGVGACSATEQTAINAIVAAGSTVVIAAGNDSANASGYSPGNCNNVVTVAATNRNGDQAWYSNFGNIIEVSAPGGETDIAANGILSTLDSGATTPNNSNSYAFYQGTSMATPHVAGVASLILGLRPAYTPAQVLSVLQSTARSFPGGSSCNTSLCGVGIVDAYQALNSLNVTFTDSNYLPVIMKPLPALTPIPTPTTPPPACVPQGGESNNINDALTTCSGHTATGQVSDADLDDVYKIQMTANQFLSISMTGSGGDADLYLYPPGTTDVTTDPYSASSINIGNNELINGQVLMGGYWYIDVYSYDGTSSYSVTATVTNALTGEVNTFSLTPEDLQLSSRSSK